MRRDRLGFRAFNPRIQVGINCLESLFDSDPPINLRRKVGESISIEGKTSTSLETRLLTFPFHSIMKDRGDFVSCIHSSFAGSRFALLFDSDPLLQYRVV